MSDKNVDAVLSALLDTEVVPEKDVYMKRFGVNFRIKAIDGKTMNRIRQQATVGKKQETDRDKYFALIIVHGCVNPNWSAPALIEKFGPTPADVVQNRLLSGELIKVAEEILDLSGFGDDEEAVDDVKN